MLPLKNLKTLLWLRIKKKMFFVCNDFKLNAQYGLI